MHEIGAIELLKRGDIRGLETLVYLYQEKALDAAYLITHDYSAAEDVVQEAFIRAYRHISRFDGSRPFGPWFLRIVVNTALTATRKATVHRELSLEAHSSGGAFVGEDQVSLTEVPSLEPGLEEMFEAAETREEVLASLDKLSPDQRAAVVMRYYLDWSDAEMSQTLGIVPGTVRWRLSRARERLRELLPAWVTHPQKGEG